MSCKKNKEAWEFPKFQFGPLLLKPICTWTLPGGETFPKPQIVEFNRCKECRTPLDVLLKTKTLEGKQKLIEKHGIESFEKYGKIIDSEKKHNYKLVDLGEFITRRYCPYLFMDNASTKERHGEGVHSKCVTIKEALQWRNKSKNKPDTLT